MATKTVLLVDDSRVARMMARAVVEKAHPDWTVVEAADGEAALVVARAAPPDFILVDVNMPGIGGVDAARQQRLLAPAARVSLLTANIQDPVRHQAEAMGIGFLAKPINAEALVAFLAGTGPGAGGA